MKRLFSKLYFWIFIKAVNNLKIQERAEVAGILMNSINEYNYSVYRKKYQIHPSFKFNGKEIVLYGDGSISCGENSYIGNYSTIQSGENCKVEIGKNCHISHNVRIYTSSNLADQPFNNQEKQEINENVIIDDYVWIGANVFICPGVVIGKNSVIGANAVVTKDVEANAIYAGVPARKLRNKTINI